MSTTISVNDDSTRTTAASVSAAIPISRRSNGDAAAFDNDSTTSTPAGSPTSHFTNSTVRLYHSPKTLNSKGTLLPSVSSYASSNALSSAESSEIVDDAAMEGTDAFYAKCHEQFGLPPLADTTILVFGYGSILWKQNFEFTSEYEVYIKGYKRVFFQSSTNHRGTEEHPGRCVTLVPTSYIPAYTEADNDAEALKARSSLVREPGLEGSKYEDRVYGKAYQLPSDPRKMYEIMRSLDTREGGYDCVQAVVYDAKAFAETSEEKVLEVLGDAADTATRKHVLCLCYIATPESEDFVGDAPLAVMAEQIVDAAGFSGPNREYLFFLAEELKKMGAHDPHVFALADEAHRILAEREAAGLASK